MEQENEILMINRTNLICINAIGQLEKLLAIAEKHRMLARVEIINVRTAIEGLELLKENQK